MLNINYGEIMTIYLKCPGLVKLVSISTGLEFDTSKHVHRATLANISALSDTELIDIFQLARQPPFWACATNQTQVITRVGLQFYGFRPQVSVGAMLLKRHIILLSDAANQDNKKARKRESLSIQE